MQSFFQIALILLATQVSSPTIEEQKAELELAKIYYYQKKYDKALDLLSKMPSSFEVDVLMGDIYTTQKEYGKAEEHFKNHKNLEAKQRDLLLFKLAEIYAWQKKYDSSLSLFETLLEHHPDDIQLRRKFAEVLMWSGQYDRAAKELEKSLEQK